MAQKYLGITPYDENGGFTFAGRNEETWLLYDRIIRNDYTVYYAASGEGKSSLIRAGLIPILRRRDYFPIYIVFKDEEFDNAIPFELVVMTRIENEIKNVMQKNGWVVTYEQSEWSKQYYSPEQSEVLNKNFWWRIRNYCFKRDDIELKPLFIFDQFEEVFTKANYSWTDAFFGWLEEISTDYVPDSLNDTIKAGNIDMPTHKKFKMLFSFRTEYLGDLDYWCVQKHFLPSLQENRICLKALTPFGAREVISLDNSLVKYSDLIVKGCAESGVDITNEKQPCVYALILSVVCQTLSGLSVSDKEQLLAELEEQQDATIDKILLNFYKEKLKKAGLDYYKNENIINDLEAALVDENGKRRRRDTNEDSMRHLETWIKLLCSTDNGLLKVIGRKTKDGETINTVEFPHDRLCKAIDSSRKERQGKIEWRLHRQGEWMQFGMITATIIVIAFLWNALMSALNPVITGILSSPKDVLKSFVDYLNYEHVELNNYSLDEGFSTLLAMSLLLVFIPLIVTFVSRKEKKWQITSAILSLSGTLLFGLLWIRNRSIHFSIDSVPVVTIVGLVACLIGSVISLIRLKTLPFNNGNTKKTVVSFWPLCGGYFVFTCYLFCEFLFRTTFGINEPCDSSWALLLLPILYTLWAWGFFCMKIENSTKLRLCGIIIILECAILLILFLISYMPYNTFKRTWGFVLSVSLIVLFSFLFIRLMQHIASDSKYFKFTIFKKILVICGVIVILVATFLLNLGFNPMAISPFSVRSVSSWRIVMIGQNNSIGEEKLGVVYSTTGETIIPCCITVNSHTESILNNGKYYIPIESSFLSSPFQDDFIDNNDKSLRWDRENQTATGYIRCIPTLEQYLHKKYNDDISKSNNIKDSVDYYSANLFREIRNANIDFLLTGEAYDIRSLKSLQILDSIQYKVLTDELKKFALDAKDTRISSDGYKKEPNRIDVMEDKHLIDFHRELSRYFLLCLIKDRAAQSDMSAMFNLSTTYLMAYFSEVPSMSFSYTSNITLDDVLNTINGNDTTRMVVKKTITYSFDSDDVLNQRVFAWYNLFNSLCWADINWNRNVLTVEIEKSVKKLEDLICDLSEVASSLTGINNIVFDNQSSSKSVSMLVDYCRNYLRGMQPEYYESILEELNNVYCIANTTDADSSLNQLKTDVINVLLPIMIQSPTNIYSNDFENVCKNLILVSAYRGYSISDDMKSFSNYLKSKNNFYYLTENIMNSIDSVQKSKKDIEEGLNSIITLLHQKQ